MGFYENLRDNTVLGMLKKFGFSCALRKTTSGTFDPVSGGMTSGPITTDYKCYGVFSTYGKRKSGAATSFLDGSEVKVKDRDMYLDASVLKVTPEPGDTVVVGKDSFKILSVNATIPGNINVIWTVTVQA